MNNVYDLASEAFKRVKYNNKNMMDMLTWKRYETYKKHYEATDKNTKMSESLSRLAKVLFIKMNKALQENTEVDIVDVLAAANMTSGEFLKIFMGIRNAQSTQKPYVGPV